jgi:hypothetical protein
LTTGVRKLAHVINVMDLAILVPDRNPEIFLGILMGGKVSHGIYQIFLLGAEAGEVLRSVVTVVVWKLLWTTGGREWNKFLHRREKEFVEIPLQLRKDNMIR